MRFSAWSAVLLVASLTIRVEASPIDETYWVHSFAKELEASRVSSGGSIAYCEVCRATVGLIRAHGESTPSETLLDVLIFLCKNLGIESSQVCHGIIPKFKDVLFTTINKTPLSASDICSLAFNNQCGSTSTETQWSVNTTGVPKPPVRQVPLPKPGSPVLRIAQLADTHVDERYVPGSLVDCNDPLCCRANSTPKKNPLGEPAKAGFWGTYSRCDVPQRTLRESVRYLAEVVKPDVVYWTGDIMPHDVWENTREDNLRQFNDTLSLLKTHLPAVKVIPAMGNHEGVPVNSFPIPQIKGDLSVEWLYNSLADLWSYYIPEENLKTFRYGGYFKYDLNPKLRILSLNMNYCNNFNWWILINGTDPTEQLDWFTKQLQECEDKGILVHLIAHIPPGSDNCLAVWSRNFNEIVNRYESTIAGHFYGHTHNDEFEVFFDKDNATRPFATAFIAPSITTFETGDPAFRVYHIDGIHDNSTYQVIDYETHYMNMELANQNPNDTYIPEWDITMSAKEVYGLPSLQPQAYADYLKKLESDDGAFKDFFKVYMKRLAHATYDDASKASILCNLRSSESNASCKV
ncbi:sphingomyelin phosphodiesterase [Galendromus occidentalis]|uniref:Sphingomyelin phosphodiesterase n=1 Tax=Galendromus occidentalis TaxID=34638 RepID=A0AAJ7SG09_9ACAR|nr:sphingomyelin phosphodiesterase [Galendromus occidentalis]